MLKKFNKQIISHNKLNITGFHTSLLKLDEVSKVTVKDHYLGNHNPVSILEKEHFPKQPYTDTSLVEKINIDEHIVPKSFGDKIAYYTMLVLRQVVHLVFRDRYSHHAVVLETVAAVPPMSKEKTSFELF